MTEVEHQFSHIFIPENKESAWVYRKGLKKPIKKDPKKEHQGIWAEEHNITALKPSPIEVWVFLRDIKTNHLEIAPGLLDNNPNHGKVGYDPKLEGQGHVNLRRKAIPEQMWFYPPGVSLPKGVKNHGIWVKPEYKRDMSKMGTEKQGFFAVSANYKQTGGKLGVKGGWKTLGAQSFVKTKNDPNKGNNDGINRDFYIRVRTHRGEIFDIKPCIPGNRFSAIKIKIEKKRHMPVADQRLSFEGIDLIDEKTIAGSGVKKGDIIDLGPMHIYVRTPKGKKYTLKDVEYNDSIADIMKMVEDIEGTSVDKQILSFKRVRMLPTKTLSTYGIRHRSTIDISGMIIFVELLTGDKVELDVESTEPISKTKTKVKNRTQILQSQQTLYFEGRHLDNDNKDLNFYNIQHLDTLVMVDKQAQREGGSGVTTTKNTTGMKIFVVKDWDQKRFVLSVEPTTTIEEVKSMIQTRENIPVGEQRLTFKKKSVYNKKTLTESRIKHNNILHLSRLGERLYHNASTPVPSIQKVKPQQPMNDNDNDDDPVATKRGPQHDKQAMPSLPGDDDDPISVPLSPNFSTKLKTSAPNDDDDDVDISDPDYSDDDDDDPFYRPSPKKRHDIPNGVPSKTLQDVSDSDSDDRLPDTAKKKTDTMEPDIDFVVKTPNSSKVYLTFPPTKTIADVKDEIKEKTGIPKRGQRIFHIDGEEREILDDTPLSKTKLSGGNHRTLELEVRQPVIEIQVPNCGSRTFILDPDDTVKDVKHEISKQFGSPPDYRLLRNGKELDDDDNLPDTIKPGDVFTLELHEIEIELPEGGKTRIGFLPTHTIEDIKDMIEEKTGIPKRGQRLFFLDNDEELSNDELPISEAPQIIQHDTQMKLRPPKVKVKGPGGKSRVFPVLFDETGKDFKKKVSKKMGFPPGQRLLFDDVELDDDEQMIDRLHHGDVLTTAPSGIDIFLPEGKVTIKPSKAKTIADVKDDIEKETGVPSHSQRIFFLDGKEELPDDTPFSKAKFKQGTKLEVKVPMVEIMDLNGNSRSFFLDPDDTVKQLKRQYFGKPLKKKLFLDGKELDDDEILVDCIHHGDILTTESNRLEIETPSGKVFLNILPAHSIDDIKRKIEEEAEIPKKGQRLFFFDDDTELGDDIPSSKIRTKGNTLKLRPPKLRVFCPNGKSRIFAMEFEETGKDFRERVAGKLGMTLDQALYFDGVELDDNVKLLDCLHHGQSLTFEPPPSEFDLPQRSKATIKITPLEDLQLTDKTDDEHPKSRHTRNFSLSTELEKDDGADLERRRYLLGIDPASNFPPIDPVDEGNEGKSNKSRTFDLIVDPDKEPRDDAQRQKVIIETDPVTVLPHVGSNDEDVDDLPRHESRNFDFEIDPDEEGGEDAQRRKVLLGIDPTTVLPEITAPDGDDDDDHPQRRRRRTFDLVIDPDDEGDDDAQRQKVVLTQDAVTVLPAVSHEEIEEAEVSKKREARIFYMDYEEELADDETKVVKLDLERGSQAEIVTLGITIEHWNGKTYSLTKVNPGEYVDDLKDRIAEHCDVPVFQQRLLHNGKPVDDSCTLEDQGIQDKSTLVLEPMRIQVLMPEGTKVTLAVEPEYKIEKVKEIMSSLIEIPGTDLCFVDGGEEYLDNETLLESRINHNDVIVLEVFEIKILDYFGETHSLLKVHRDDSIEEVKNIISQHLDLSTDIDKHCITYDGEQVPNDIKLSAHGIGHKSVLVLIDPDNDEIDIPEASKISATVMKTATFMETTKRNNSDYDEIWPLVPDWGQRIFFFDSGDDFESEIQILVTLIDGDVLKFEVRPTQMVDQIKNKILKERKHFKKKSYKLKCRGKVLNDKKSLLAQEVGHNSALIMEPLKQKKIEDLPQASKLRFDLMPAALCGEEQMTLQIQDWKGKKFSLVVDAHFYIDDIKELIETERGIPIGQQRLNFEGRPVDEYMTLEEQSIVDESRLVLEPMQIHVAVDGKIDTYTVELEYTISRLKGMLFSKLGIPAVDQVILFGSVELEDDQTLEESQVNHDDVVVLENYEISVLHWSGEVFKLKGIRRADKIRAVRKKLNALTKIPKSQEFKFEDKPIDESLTFGEQKLKHKSILTMEDASLHAVSVPKFERFSLSLFPTTHSNDAVGGKDGVITLKVKHWNGGKFSIEAKPTDYCDDVRDRIESLKNIPSCHQRLTFKGSPVDDAMTLEEQQIVNGSRLQLEPMKVHVNVPHGKMLSFEVDPDHTTISKLKGLIFSKIGTPSKDQAIVDAGEELDDNKTLNEYQIDHLDTLTMEVYEISYVLLPGDPEVLSGVRRTDTIERVKKKVFLRSKIPIDRQRYRFQDRPIDESKTLQKQGLKHNSLLILEETS